MNSLPFHRSITSLKRDAKAIKKAAGCKLHEAQREIAKRFGFASWGLLHKYCSPREEMWKWFLDHHVQDTFNPFDDDIDDGVVPPTVDVKHVLRRKFPTAAPTVLDDVEDALGQEGDWVSSEVLAAINWFLANHERAVERSPYESREGGYQYPLVDVYDVISSTFSELPEEDVDAIVKAIERFDDAWIEGDFLDQLDEEAITSVTVDIYD